MSLIEILTKHIHRWFSLGLFGLSVERSAFAFQSYVAAVSIVFAQNPEVLRVKKLNAVSFIPCAFYHRVSHTCRIWIRSAFCVDVGETLVLNAAQTLNRAFALCKV